MSIVFLILTVCAVGLCQTATSIKVTYKPGNIIMNGESKFITADWVRVDTDRGSRPACFPFLEVNVYTRSTRDNKYQHRVDVTNTTMYPVAVTCSNWGLGSGGRTTIGPGYTRKGDSFNSDDGYPDFIIRDIRFEYPKEARDRYGFGYVSAYIDCGQSVQDIITEAQDEKEKKEREELVTKVKAEINNINRKTTKDKFDYENIVSKYRELIDIDPDNVQTYHKEIENLKDAISQLEGKAEQEIQEDSDDKAKADGDSAGQS